MGVTSGTYDALNISRRRSVFILIYLNLLTKMLFKLFILMYDEEGSIHGIIDIILYIEV